jgi:hypothetical protein
MISAWQEGIFPIQSELLKIKTSIRFVEYKDTKNDHAWPFPKTKIFSGQPLSFMAAPQAIAN